MKRTVDMTDETKETDNMETHDEPIESSAQTNLLGISRLSVLLIVTPLHFSGSSSAIKAKLTSQCGPTNSKSILQTENKHKIYPPCTADTLNTVHTVSTVNTDQIE